LLLQRLFQYQKERFPLLVHGILIAAFSFSAIGYSHQLRHVVDFIPIWKYLLCVFSNLAVFFLLRVADEHKDQRDDAKYRPYLPVPRGLISLKELRSTGFVFLSLAIIANAMMVPAVLPLLLVTLGYLLLMRYEFFIPEWLRKHMGWYMISHMFIIPLADIYASGYDWKLAGVKPNPGLLFFFGVSYCNGIVLEIGRKLRAPEAEEEGVETYTRLWGLKTAVGLWFLAITINFLLAVSAVIYAASTKVIPILIGFIILSLLPTIFFLRKPSVKLSKTIEAISLIWALAMYLLIGGIPQLFNLIK
jgi:4-hydroxybenzoate polyprenyltransferase